MALITIGALLLGVLLGQTAPEGLFSDMLVFLTEHTDAVLFLLMFTVGISVGANRPVIRKLRETDLRILLVPLGVTIGSLAGGVLCFFWNRLSLAESVAVGSGMGWYSLSGVLLGDAFGADVGAVAFLSNLFRELFSFLLIPLAARFLNGYAAIGLAGATSEDTALPILMRHTSEEMVIYSVISGVVTSSLVPVLSRLCIALGGAA